MAWIDKPYWMQIQVTDDHLPHRRRGAFDQLQPASKLSMIALVGQALSEENEPCPLRTALTHGTFGAIYAAIRQEVEIAIDMGRERPQPEREDFLMHPLVLSAVLETNPDWENPIPDPDDEDQDWNPPSLPRPNCEDIDAWDELLDELMDRALWDDRDFEEEDVHEEFPERRL
jgi:hypothetical protein